MTRSGMFRRVLSTILMTLATAAVAQANANSQLAYKVDSYLRMAETSGFSGGITIVVSGKNILTRGYGYANRATGVPFTADTLAQVGSITKTFTALAIVELVSEGALDLNAPASRYLRDSAVPARNATIGSLLTHTAGLADDCGPDYAPLSHRELLNRCMALPLAYPVGSYHYSNLGYSILAAVVEQVTKHDWERYLREMIWIPNSMSSTTYVTSNLPLDRFAVGTLAGKPQAVQIERLRQIQPDDWHLRGDGGIESSLSDMGTFGQLIFSDRSGLRAATRAQMLTPHAADGSIGVGYGLFFTRDGAGKVVRIGHSGSDGVFFSYLGYLPQEKLIFYIVGTNGEAAVKAVVRHVLDLMSS